MKKFYSIIATFLVCSLANAQLTIYSGLNQTGTSGTCVSRTTYTNVTAAAITNVTPNMQATVVIPSNLNDAIKSIRLNQGFQATVAENPDGSGERFSYMAVTSALNVNLAFQLQNKISFIRVLPLPGAPVKKKGAGVQNNAERDALNISWWYDWGRDDISTATQEYAPMMWGAYSTFEATMNTIASKTGVTNLMAFNEPDGAGQGGGSLITTNVAGAIPYYKRMLRAGMRMVSPAPTEGKERVWLDTFADIAATQKLQIDAIAMHWYDWGFICSNYADCNSAGGAVNNDATAIFNRFKSSVNACYALHQKPIWITEFNASQYRPDATHAAFINLALPWLDANPNVERYAYFFGNDAPARNTNGTLTLTGQAYFNQASVNAYPSNIYDTRSDISPIVLAAWDPSALLQGGRGVAIFDPTYLDANITAPSGLTRGTGVVVPTTAASNGYWGANDCSTTTAAAGVSSNRFLKFSLKSNNGKSVTYTAIDKFNIRISSSGPIKYQIDYQIDNGAFSPCATVTGPTATTGNYVLGPIDLSSITGLQNVSSTKTVTFRITPFEASSASGSFLIGSGTADTDPDLTIMGVLTDNIVTPVTLSDFKSSRQKDKVVLKWTTQSEINFSHFSLERSTDGKTFYEIAKVDASKNAAGSLYAYKDNAPDATAVNYYRLKMVDVDGSFVYSKIISESFQAKDALFEVYPSITKGNTIETRFKEVSEATQIKLFNVNGQLLQTYDLEVGTSAKTLEIGPYTEGVYFLMLQDKGAVQTRKFIKQ
jgi:Glycosyl hydrolase catalytic core